MVLDSVNKPAGPPIHHDASEKQANVPGTKEDAPIITPEPRDMDGELPVLKRDQKADGGVVVMGLEIPDSEGPSEFSSPAKVDGDKDERRNAILQGDGALQPVEEGQEVEDEGEDTVIEERKLTRLEIPNREETSDFSTPVKADLGVETAGDGAVQTVGGLKTIGEGQEQNDQQEDAAIMDVSVLVRDNGMGGVDGSRAREGIEIEIEISKASEGGGFATKDATKEVDYASNWDGGMLPSAMDEGPVQVVLSKEIQDAQLTDTTLYSTETRIDNQEHSSTGAAHGVELYQATPYKGEDVEATQAQAPSNAHGEALVLSPVFNLVEVAIPAQKLLDGMSPAISDISDTVSKPRLVQTINMPAIPDSDDDEDYDLPDAPKLDMDNQRPAPRAALAQKEQNRAHSSSIVNGVRAYKTIEIQSSMEKPRIAENGHEKEQTLASFNETCPSPKAMHSAYTVSSTPQPANNRRLNKDRTSPSSSVNQSTQGAEQQSDTELLSSPTKLQASSPKSEKKTFQPSATTHALHQQDIGLSQAINIPSSPPQLTSEDSFKAKRRKAPYAMLPAPASQNKDVLIAELKAMKIASIQARITALEAEIASKRAKLEEVTKILKQPAAITVKRHIKLLHDYNDIKDVGQGLVGMIADNRGVRIGELYQEFGVDFKD